jgi:alpha-amylase/alpha-mannosidase (GH57 family)
MIYGNFLHIYQPPDQHEDTLRQIVKESYYPLVKILKENPEAKLTLNIAGSLTEQLIALGYQDFIEDLKFLIKNGQLELTESSKYHAFLPLLPSSEVERQIRLNHQIHRKVFGNIYQPKGIHLPEMAYSFEVAKVVSKLGYSWLILNEVSFEGKLFSKIDTSKIYKLEKLPQIKILFRNRKLSDLIQRGFLRETNDFYQFLEKEIKDNEYVITAMDGETFGHHRPGLEKFLAKIYEEKKIKTATISEIINSFPEGTEIKPVEGSWASMESEIKKKIPFAQWNYPGNPIHKRQWELTYLAINTVNKYQKDPKIRKARRMLDKSLFSCQYWWAGAVPWWEIEYIEKGAYYLKSTIEILEKIPLKIKKRAQKLYNEIVFTAFDWERSGLAHKKSMEYTKKIINELGEKIPDVSTLHSKK